MVRALLLICSLNTPSDQCDANSARSVTVLKQDSVLCGPQMQFQMAEAPGIFPKDDEYLKIVCERGSK